MKKIFLSSLLFALSAGGAAADLSAGKNKAMICASCHGANGVSTVPIYPNLKGQKEAYIISSLKAYKSGQRKGGMAALMKAQVSMLSDADIADLAAYYASLK